MSKRDRSLQLLIIYFLAGVCLIPIIRYLIVFVWTTNPDAEDYFVFVRLFLSAPILIALGVLLSLLFKGIVHRLFGVIFLLIGILWIIVLTTTLIGEAA